MNNLATSLLLQTPPLSFSPSTPAPSKDQQISSARAWAQKAVSLASNIQTPLRNEECENGCAVAMVNLGEMAAMEGNLEKAREWFTAGKRKAKALGWKEGILKATEGERKLGAG